MTKLTLDDYVKLVKMHGLRKLNGNHYMLLDCNLVFEYNLLLERVDVHGVIPLDLAMEMYEAFKDIENPPFINSINNKLVNPLEIAAHPSIDISDMPFKFDGNKYVSEILNEERTKAIVQDYQNCYINFSSLYTPDALEWYINTAKVYYATKRGFNR